MPTTSVFAGEICGRMHGILLPKTKVLGELEPLA